MCQRAFDGVWDKYFPYFRQRKGKRACTCDDCGEFRDLLSKERDPKVRVKIERNRAKHLALVREERHRYYFRQKLAQDRPDLFLSLIIDGMDQSTCYLPNLHDSVHLSTPLNVKLTGAIAHGRPNPRRVFLSTDHAGNTDLYCQVLVETLKEVCGGDFSKLPPVLFLQLDNTGSTNKNNLEVAMASYLVERGIHSEVLQTP